MGAGVTWLDLVASLVEGDSARGGFAVCFPEYRPDLARELAYRLQLRFYDYREEQLRPHGPEAHQVSLSDLDEVLGALAEEGGAVVLNVEALLAAKPEQERANWLARFLDAGWSRPLVLPLTLFAHELDSASARVLRLAEGTLPEQSLVSRLLH